MQKGLKAVFIREVHRMSLRSIYLWILFILPLFSFLLFVTMFKHGKAENFDVVVFDADNTPLSRQIIRWVDATHDVHISKHVSSLEEGKRMIERSETWAVLKIPKGTENDVYKGDAKGLVLFYSNENLSAGSAVSTAIITTVKTLSAGINLQKRMAHGQMYEQAYERIQPIHLETHSLFNPYVNYAYYLVTALLPVMLLMFVITSAIFTVGNELKEGTAQDWYHTAGDSVIVALTGKLLPYSIVYIIEAFLMNTILFVFMDAPLNGNLFIVFMSTIFFVYAYQAMGVFIISIFPNVRLSLSLGAAYASLAFSFSGLTFPMIAMDPFLQYFAELFPYTHYLKIYINEAMKGLDLRYSLYSFMALSIFIALPFLLIGRLRHFLTDAKYWGKS